MKQQDIKALKIWFSDYVSRYLKNNLEYDYAIKLKKDHTERVCKNIIQLGKDLNLSEQDMLLAETIALFHDLGRFRQYAEYGTFKDADSENHAKLSVKELVLNKVLANCSSAERKTVVKAVAWHNALALPKDIDEKDLFFMKLIRDADKLDIWGVFAALYKDKKHNSIVELGLPDIPVCSEKAIDSFTQKHMVRLEDIKTLNDFKLLQLSWIYDINFKESLVIANQRKDLDIISDSLPRSEKLDRAVQAARKYLLTSIPLRN
ncbi:HD domain-containing protein [Desulfonema limicola]|uniref:HD domain-containing protein n=1 Tax=Desulfonema limicola TaxID=45656 RepID=A0A975GIV3_9BACT|nr:HD domain-containing protein [Desulfonema limicola]QTA82318.1 HD domain-containing protein [Desulfonema limicola]